MQRRPSIAALFFSCTAIFMGGAQAQANYPEQPIKWIVPYPPGGGTDTLARTRAATNIAADAVAKAKPDGYTIMSADNAMMAFNEHLFKKLPYNPAKDFTYIGALARFPLVLVVHPSFPAHDFKAFLAYVQANPGKVNYASVGNGSPHHLAMEMFKYRTGTDLLHVPYKGAAPAVQDVLSGGDVKVMFIDLPAGLQFIKTGKLRVLAIGTSKRTPLLPKVPTLKELGVTDADVFAFQGIVGPAGLPPEVTKRLNHELNHALSTPVVVHKFTQFGMDMTPTTPEQFRTMARAESERWGPVIQARHITLD
jgi:tripartite-type tricarboxylate transporter receptor subunit TctC